MLDFDIDYDIILLRKGREMRKLVSTEFTITRNEEDFDGYIEGEIIYNVDRSYGEDADGNRGQKRIFIDDIKDLQMFTNSGEEIILGRKEHDEACEILTRKFFE